MRMPRLVIPDSRLVRRLPQGWYQNMWETACQASLRSYAPYSKYYVGAAVLSWGGDIYGGCNVECADYDGTHAEESAMVAMVMAGERSVRAVLCVARPGSQSGDPAVVIPCGKCRQKITEFSVPDSTFVLARPDNSFGVETIMIEALLPHSFKLMVE